MNDTTRQVGGALGVAVVGSVMTSEYGSRCGRDHRRHIPVGAKLLGRLVKTCRRTRDRDQQAGAGRGANKTDPQINEAFVSGMHRGVVRGGRDPARRVHRAALPARDRLRGRRIPAGTSPKNRRHDELSVNGTAPPVTPALVPDA